MEDSPPFILESMLPIKNRRQSVRLFFYGSILFEEALLGKNRFGREKNSGVLVLSPEYPPKLEKQ